MAITFKSIPKDQLSAQGRVASKVRDALGLPSAVEVHVGHTATTLAFEGAKLTLPIGTIALSNNAVDYKKVLASVSMLFPMGEAPSAPAPTPIANLDDDEVWMQHVADKLFPGVLALHTATELHQRVTGTSNGSVYRVCFVGPELRGACRIKGNGVSFRFTTKDNVAPTGDISNLLVRLGVTSTKDTHMSSHTSMTGTFDEVPGEYRALFGAFYGALGPHLTSKFPNIKRLSEDVV